MLMNLENLSVPNLKELALASQLLEKRRKARRCDSVLISGRDEASDTGSSWDITPAWPTARRHYQQDGVYAGRLLKGAKPADLPTAKALGLKCRRRCLPSLTNVIE